MSKIKILVLVCVLCLHIVPAQANASKNKAILAAMQSEILRSKKMLVLDDYEAPYFISYQLKQTETKSIMVRYGAVYQDTSRETASLNVEVRVGDYAFDNTGDQYYGFYPGSRISPFAPTDGNLEAIRTSLWALTDAAYREALRAYLAKRGKGVYEAPEKELASFSKEQAVKFNGKPSKFKFDRKLWKKRLLKLSKLFEGHKEILQSRIQLQAQKVSRWYINTEGSKVVDDRVMFSLLVNAEARANDDTILDNSRNFYAPAADKMPSMKKMTEQINEMIAELIALMAAPLIDPYSGPAILSPTASAVLFHEAIGHRLEGDRQNSEHSGRTFKGKSGSLILPTFLSLYDDPTLRMMNGEYLNGHYLYDDEAVKARKTMLVENGVLKSFLMSRTPVKGFNKSNGHGRSEGTAKPMSRMGNLVLTSTKSVSFKELKVKLIEVIIAKEKPYGLLIEDMEGGSTNTSSYGYQAFKGIPRIVWRIYPDGKEELVRGVELVGTPLTSIGKIILTSKELGVFNGYCGAESGWIPVSAIAPAILLEELELQRKKEDKRRSPILQSPFNGQTKQTK